MTCKNIYSHIKKKEKKEKGNKTLKDTEECWMGVHESTKVLDEVICLVVKRGMPNVIISSGSASKVQ